MNPNCIYEVKTYWGYFRLDEGAYADYLKGKLWISWVPGKQSETKVYSIPPIHVSDKAVALYYKAEMFGAWELTQALCSVKPSVWPYKPHMSGINIYEMNLSVRSSNGLMRAGATTIGEVAKLIELPDGLKSVRNLGAKSEQEILRCFFEICYLNLSQREKMEFWQETLSTSLSGIDAE